MSNNTINILLDNDKFLGYANAGISYVLNKTNYAMEFGLSYYGNFGDRSISNWRNLEIYGVLVGLGFKCESLIISKVYGEIRQKILLNLI